MGTHPKAPAMVLSVGESGADMSIGSFLAKHPSFHGSKVLDVYGLQLPYLFKASRSALVQILSFLSLNLFVSIPAKFLEPVSARRPLIPVCTKSGAIGRQSSIDPSTPTQSPGRGVPPLRSCLALGPLRVTTVRLVAAAPALCICVPTPGTHVFAFCWWVQSLHARDPRNYPDANHKPELACAAKNLIPKP